MCIRDSIWEEKWINWSVESFFLDIGSDNAVWGVEDRVRDKIRKLFPNPYKPPPNLRMNLKDEKNITLPTSPKCYAYIIQEIVNCGRHLKFLTEVGKTIPE